MSKTEVVGLGILVAGISIALVLGLESYPMWHIFTSQQESQPHQVPTSQQESQPHLPTSQQESQPHQVPTSQQESQPHQVPTSQQESQPHQVPQAQFESSYLMRLPKTMTDTSVGSQKPILIGGWHAIMKENGVSAILSLTDESNNYIAVDGSADISILNSKMEQVYSGTIDVKKEDFMTTSLTRTDIQGVEFNIPLNEIGKGKSNQGTIYLKFRTIDHVLEEIATPINGLPIMTDNQIRQFNEMSYSKSAATVNQQLSFGSFEITVTKVGKFDNYDSTTEGQVFRVDLQVKNIGNQPESFNPTDLILLDNDGNQYDYLYGGMLMSDSQINPGVEKNGYIMFNKVPIDVQSVMLLFQMGHDQSFNPYNFKYNISLK